MATALALTTPQIMPARSPLAEILDFARSTLSEAVTKRRPAFGAELLAAQAKDIVVISCIDYRESGRHGFLLTSAGNIPHPSLIEDLHLVLPNKKFLVLQGHSDCAKSMREVGPQKEGEPDTLYKGRVDLHTLKRLWRDAERLLSDPDVKDAVRNGMRFCAAFRDVTRGETVYLEDRSRELVRSILNSH